MGRVVNRRARAAALRKLLLTGPSSLNAPDNAFHPGDAKREEVRAELWHGYQLWLNSWVIPELDDLVPELKKEAENRRLEERRLALEGKAK
jgi:hypothetical protein